MGTNTSVTIYWRPCRSIPLAYTCDEIKHSAARKFALLARFSHVHLGPPNLAEFFMQNCVSDMSWELLLSLCVRP